MKKITLFLLAVQTLTFGSLVHATSVDVKGANNYSYKTDVSMETDMLVGLDIKLYHKNELVLRGWQTGISGSPIVFNQESYTEYTSSINTTVSADGEKQEHFDYKVMENGLFLSFVPVVRNGFISGKITLNYSVLNNLTKTVNGLDLPDVRKVSINRPLFFKSGESRSINYCMKNESCIVPEYKLVLKASIINPNVSL
ncbi:hypothetical protein P7F73_18480 [Enterobacter sp. EC-ML 621]|uniref:hypothetical protein n=1 Tax=Enterobacter TaxID=547 RepID=UPI002853C917|nr:MULTISPECIES: hypothetical protein [Enterobacter]MDR5095802.1 hypothetical protein [Enterobacter sp. EC-ML 621]